MFSEQDIHQFKQQLQKAILICREHCLYNSTKWVTEILDGIPEHFLNNDQPFTIESNLPLLTTTDLTPELTATEFDKYQRAQVLFEQCQFDNVAAILKGYTAPRLRFLRLYATYLAGEKHKEEATQDIPVGPTEIQPKQNEALNGIYEELRPIRDSLDAFNLYLYGIVLCKREMEKEAAAALLESVKMYEYNWSAWMQLGTLASTTKQFYDLKERLDQELEKSIVKNLFLARLALEIHLPSNVFWEFMQPLEIHFKGSIYIKSQLAMAFYNALEYDKAEDLFDQIRQENPYRLEDMDVYSNLLYLQGSREKLSVLAHECIQIDQYQPETCCIVANYHSATGEIAESVKYFKRALKLNRSYHLAWTLLGHDYIELKNTDAAIDCYNRAIAINRRDYRAWYGLGQAEEMIDKPEHALYYYQKATELRPDDERMWKALGGCYGHLHQDDKALECYERAAALNNM
ncbi:cell division cycle 23-like protein, isoform CRA_a [Phascolomyces articulosus]|uniref:Cell division cycle 23-like protein, isoform CRA_a n=1 Tax=Phascolomyces articulosus TaxID=60185 RepID=A0AAD5K2K7_9FUNG|nr:cell division cycle 23-like protein, isoform CRA_a [Phascolomyces articulosus]